MEGGRGLPVRRHSYGGHRVELWKASDWLKNDKKQLKVKQSRQSRVHLGLIRPKQVPGSMRFGPMAGLAERAFDLIHNSPVFFPKRTRYICF